MPAVTDSEDKGNVRADISDDVIQEALRSVERRTAKPSATAPNQVELQADAEAASALGAAALEVSLEVEPSASAEELEALRKQVSQLTAQLDFSQSKSRELMEKLKEDHERALRAAADLDNFKKRAMKEKEEVQKFGNERLLRDFLPIIDNLDRAFEHSHNVTDAGGFVTGVQMTRKLFEDALAKHGVKGFTSKGQPFDPHLHEAMGQAETSDVPPNHVVQEVLRGYLLNDRLIRPALVMVARAPAAAAASPEPVAAPEPGDTEQSS